MKPPPNAVALSGEHNACSRKTSPDTRNFERCHDEALLYIPQG